MFINEEAANYIDGYKDQQGRAQKAFEVTPGVYFLTNNAEAAIRMEAAGFEIMIRNFTEVEKEAWAKKNKM